MTDATTAGAPVQHRRSAFTSEGTQELRRRVGRGVGPGPEGGDSPTDPDRPDRVDVPDGLGEDAALDLLGEGGAVLRIPEGFAVDATDVDVEVSDDETMIINLGPQHPSTHGVLRVMLELDGETVLRCKPVVGYLHTGMEKTGEELLYIQGSTNVTRMDYLACFNNEAVFSLAVERLLDIEVPDRGQWIRTLMCELNRISSHLVWIGTNSNDLGGVGVFTYILRERELLLAFFEKVTGLRMNHNYIRPGGVAADLPAGWRQDVMTICDVVEARLAEYEWILTGQPIFIERTRGVGVITREQALALSITGPVLRSTGVDWDLRRDLPYLKYADLDFDVVIGGAGDCWDRYAQRVEELRQSVRMCRQMIDLIPPGDVRVQDRKITPPPRARIDESMEALIHHFKLFTEGFKVPAGETYVAVESPRGELGCYLVSDGTAKPYRLHIRAPSFANLQAMPVMMHGGLVADAIAIISTIDPVMGDVDR